MNPFVFLQLFWCLHVEHLLCEASVSVAALLFFYQLGKFSLWTEQQKKKSSPIIVLLFIGCLCQTVGSCYLCINCVIHDIFLQSPPPIPKLSRFPYEHVSVNRTCFSYSVSLFVFFLQKWLFAFSSFHVIILLVHLLSISRA